MKAIIYLWYLFLKMRNVPDKSSTENQKHILVSITYFLKSCRLWDNVKKCHRARQAMDESMALVHCMLGT
jgi:hypothetical protein